MLDITSKKSVKAYLRSHKLECLYSFIGASWKDSAEQLLSRYDAFTMDHHTPRGAWDQMDADWLYEQLSDAEKRQRYNEIHGTACSCAKKPLASASSTSSSSSTAGNAPSRTPSIAPVKEEPLDEVEEEEEGSVEVKHERLDEDGEMEKEEGRRGRKRPRPTCEEEEEEESEDEEAWPEGVKPFKARERPGSVTTKYRGRGRRNAYYRKLADDLVEAAKDGDATPLLEHREKWVKTQRKSRLTKAGRRKGLSGEELDAFVAAGLAKPVRGRGRPAKKEEEESEEEE